jgi:hypothetical protein
MNQTIVGQRVRNKPVWNFENFPVTHGGSGSRAPLLLDSALDGGECLA